MGIGRGSHFGSTKSTGLLGLPSQVAPRVLCFIDAVWCLCLVVAASWTRLCVYLRSGRGVCSSPSSSGELFGSHLCGFHEFGTVGTVVKAVFVIFLVAGIRLRFLFALCALRIVVDFEFYKF